MKIGEIVETGAEAAGFARRVGTVWATAIIVTVLGGMFVVDRFTMSDRWTASDQRSFEERLTQQTAAYRARADSEREATRQRLILVEREQAVRGKSLENIESNILEIKASIKTLIDRR